MSTIKFLLPVGFPGGFLERLRQSRDRTTAAFYLLIMAAAVFIAVMGISANGQTLIMKKFHLRGISYPHWAVLQFVPSMYHFSNELWISRQPLTEQAIAGSAALPAETLHLWVNHFPLNFVYFSLTHRTFFDKGYRYVALRSVYRDHQLITVYRVARRGEEWVFIQDNGGGR
jgi:hypothetical protein